MKKYVLFSLINLFVLRGYSQNENNHNLPSNFGDICFKHVEELASYGIRTSGQKSELKTISYITSKFKEYGLIASIDSFNYKSFKYDSATLYIDNQRIEFSPLFINPYLKEVNIESEIFILNTPLKDLKEDLSNKIVLASSTYSFFDLFKINAKAIVIVQDSLYRKLKTHNINSKISLKVYGSIEEHKSYNVIGNLNSITNNAKEIIVSAHWDSKVGPGADDNASGISVMLELANYFKQIDNLPYNLKFIAFGAEELGMLGSQAYLNKHPVEFENCALNINLDAIGGNREITVEVHKSLKEDIIAFQKLSSTVRFCSSTDERHRWIMIAPELYTTTLFTEMNQIPWIDEIISKASEESNINYKYGLSDGDHRILSLSGTPVIGINVPGNRYHVPEDIPETVNKSSLENVGKLSKNIILGINSFSNNKDN
jgi:hypothetical protein